MRLWRTHWRLNNKIGLVLIVSGKLLDVFQNELLRNHLFAKGFFLH